MHLFLHGTTNPCNLIGHRVSRFTVLPLERSFEHILVLYLIFSLPLFVTLFFFSPFHFLLETTTFHLLTRILPKMSTYIIIYFCYITISRSTIIENREQRFLQFNWHIRCACTIARIARKRYRRKMKRNKKKRKKNHLWRRKTKTMNL